MAEEFVNTNPYAHRAALTLVSAWEGLNLPAALGFTALFRMGSVTFTGLPVPRAGRLYSMTARFSSALTAGTATVRFALNGAGVAATDLVFAAGDTVKSQTFAIPAAGASFVALDRIGFLISTSAAFLPLLDDLQMNAEILWDDWV